MTSGPGLVGHDISQVVRPAAVLEEARAVRLIEALHAEDVSRGGTWNASTSLWQRFDTPWNGPGGTRGTSSLIGSIAVQYDTPTRRAVTIYKVTLTPVGQAQGWTIDRICDSALRHVGLTLADCPRADLVDAPVRDPFRRPGL